MNWLEIKTPAATWETRFELSKGHKIDGITFQARRATGEFTKMSSFWSQISAFDTNILGADRISRPLLTSIFPHQPDNFSTFLLNI